MVFCINIAKLIKNDGYFLILVIFIKKMMNMIKRILKAIKDFFMKLFGIKKKETKCTEYTIKYFKRNKSVVFFAEPKDKK